MDTDSTSPGAAPRDRALERAMYGHPRTGSIAVDLHIMMRNRIFWALEHGEAITGIAPTLAHWPDPGLTWARLRWMRRVAAWKEWAMPLEPGPLPWRTWVFDHVLAPIVARSEDAYWAHQQLVTLEAALFPAVRGWLLTRARATAARTEARNGFQPKQVPREEVERWMQQ